MPTWPTERSSRLAATRANVYCAGCRNEPIVGRSGCELQVYNMSLAAAIFMAVGRMESAGSPGVPGPNSRGFQGVPGGSGGFRRHALGRRPRKLLVFGPPGGGSSAGAEQFKIKKGKRGHTHDHGGAVGRMGWRLLELYASPLLGHLEFYARPIEAPRAPQKTTIPFTESTSSPHKTCPDRSPKCISPCAKPRRVTHAHTHHHHHHHPPPQHSETKNKVIFAPV